MKLNSLFLSLSFLTSFGLLNISYLDAATDNQVTVDGSSTVFLISEAVGEDFQNANRGIKVAVATSGTGGGFKKFCKAEVDITGASRPIEAQEKDACAKAKIEFVELPVAYDGIAVVINKTNTWAKTLTTAELKKIWNAGSTINNWKDVRAGFPDKKLTLFGPGHDSGTFDYFTKVINGKEKASRADFTASEDDNTLVKGVEGNEGALGYFGFAYYESNKAKLNVVGIDAGKGAVTPSAESIHSTKYAPLSRPLFIYASKAALEKKTVADFADFYLANAKKLSSEVGYVPFDDKVYSMVTHRLTMKITGSIFDGVDLKTKSRTLESLLTASNKTSRPTKKK